jgi:UDP-glucose 4-epimerase
VVARLFNTVGPRQTGRYGMVLPRFIEAAKRGEPLRVHGDGSQTRCFCYVGDVVESLMRLQNCTAAQGEVFNVGSTEEISITELAKLVIEILGSKSKLEFVPYSTAYPPGFDDMRRRKPCVQKLENVAQYRPAKSLAEIIKIVSG